MWMLPSLAFIIKKYVAAIITVAIRKNVLVEIRTYTLNWLDSTTKINKVKWTLKCVRQYEENDCCSLCYVLSNRMCH